MAGFLFYTGSAVIFLWGVGHLIPTPGIVKGFGPLSEDNRRIITMEWIAEGMTLCFIGVLVFVSVMTTGPGLPSLSAVRPPACSWPWRSCPLSPGHAPPSFPCACARWSRPWSRSPSWSLQSCKEGTKRKENGK